jgi:hypothetical protein
MPKKGKCYAVIQKGKNKGKYCYEVNEYCKNSYHRGYKIKLKHYCDTCGLEFNSKYKYNSHKKSQLCVPKGECINCNNKDLEILALKKSVEKLNDIIDDLRKKIDTFNIPKNSSNDDLRNLFLNLLKN